MESGDIHGCTAGTYRTLVSFLGEALGPDYEVVLHDLTSEEGIDRCTATYV